MTVRVITPSSSTPASTSALALNQHLISADFTIPDGETAMVSRYVEIATGVTLTTGTDSDLEIG